MESFLQQALTFAGTFNPHLIVFLFLICAIGEFSVSVPYLLETVWLMTGFSFGAGTLSPVELVLLWLVAQVGRQIGAFALSNLGHFGSLPVMRLYQKYLENSVLKKRVKSGAVSSTVIRKMRHLSPFSVAMGRLLWLRMAITLTLGVKRKQRLLAAGVLLSSLVWDGIYISLGVVGAKTSLKPVQMVLYSLIGLSALYLATFLVRRLLRRRLPVVVTNGN